MIIELTIEQLAKYIEEFKSISLLDNKEISTSDLDIKVPALDRNVTVDWFIKKFNLPVLHLVFSNGYEVKVATKHILQSNGNDVFAKDLKIGSKVDHLNGQIVVTNIINAPNEDCYDVAIPSPHLYYDANGLVHHNTIMTAALSKLVEPYGRSLVIVPNKSLVTQTEDDYKNLGLDVGVYFGDRKEYGKKHTICTWQSFMNIMKATKDGTAKVTLQDFIDDVICVIVDECFDRNSRVLTPAGYVAITDIKPGDSVINYSEELQQFKIDTVVKQHKNLTKSESEKMYELEFDNGTKIQVTGNHKFLTNAGWVRADELTEEHEIVNKT